MTYVLDVNTDTTGAGVTYVIDVNVISNAPSQGGGGDVTQADLNAAVAALVDAAPEDSDTLNELANKIAALIAAGATDAEVLAAIANHNAATTDVHGIADTAVLETQTGAQSKATAAQNNAISAAAVDATTKADAAAAASDPAGTAATVVAVHVNDTSGAHAASAIAFTPTGSVSATTVQGAIAEVAAEAGVGSGDMVSTNNLSDVDDAADARNNLGLGTAAVADAGDFDADGTATAVVAALPTLDTSDNVKVPVGTSDIGGGVLVTELDVDGLATTDDVADATTTLLAAITEGLEDVTLDDESMADDSSSHIPTQHAAKTYTDTEVAAAIGALAELESSDPDKVPVDTVAGVTTIDVDGLVARGALHTVADAAYTIDPGDEAVVYTSLATTSKNATLPAANAVPANYEITVYDGSGNASETLAIGVVRAGSDTIVGGGLGAFVGITTGYGSVTVRSDGVSKWYWRLGSPFISTSSDWSSPTDNEVAAKAATKTYVDTKLAKSTATTKGDLYVATASATVVRKPVGTFGQVLKADSNETDGLVYGYAQSLRDRYLKPTSSEETFPRGRMDNITVPSASGVVHLVAIALPKNRTITNITFVSGTTAAVAPTNWWFALCDSAFLQLRATADQTSTAWAANTIKTLALATPFVTTYEGLYCLAICMAAGTVISASGVASFSATPTGISPRTTLTGLTGQTAPVSDGTNLAPSPGASGGTPWAYIT